MSRSRLLGMSPAAVAAALLAGALLGALFHRPVDRNADRAGAEAGHDSPVSSNPRTANSGNDTTGAVVRRPGSVQSPPEPAPASESEEEQIFAQAGLALKPMRDGNRFVGYRVLENASDARFSVGDVIVEIDGRPVEGTAAGSELMIAALANPQASVKVLEDKDR